MLRGYHFVIACLIGSLAVAGCGRSQPLPLPDGKVVLHISLKGQERLFTRLGFTNLLSHGPVERDSSGTRLFLRVETGSSFNPVQELRTQQLVVVTAEGVHMKPWHFPANERVSDAEEVAVWQHPKPPQVYQVRNGELLAPGCNVAAVSGEWLAVEANGRSPWLARLNTPSVATAEFPDAPGLIAIYAQGQVVHVFVRRGWRNDEGPMKYLVYDFARAGSTLLKEVTLPAWARITLDMDPETGHVVLNDNNKFWGRTWLLDLKTGKRKNISSSDWTLIVRKEVAQKWIELTKP
jgi:hypothetical protein